MEYTTCKDTIMELINDGSKEFGKTFKISQDTVRKLNDVCDGVDKLVSEIECEIVQADIDRNEKSLRITIVCDELELHGGRTNPFFSLIMLLDSFSFSKCGDESLRIELDVKNIWGQASE